MKQINIIGSQIVDGELRFQHENPIETTNAEAKRLHDGGALLDEPVDAAKKPTKPETIEPSIPADADNG